MDKQSKWLVLSKKFVFKSFCEKWLVCAEIKKQVFEKIGVAVGVGVIFYAVFWGSGQSWGGYFRINFINMVKLNI